MINLDQKSINAIILSSLLKIYLVINGRIHVYYILNKVIFKNNSIVLV